MKANTITLYQAGAIAPAAPGNAFNDGVTRSDFLCGQKARCSQLLMFI